MDGNIRSIYSVKSDLEFKSVDLHQTASALCQLNSSGTGSNNANAATQVQGNGLTPNTMAVGLVVKDGSKWEYCTSIFFTD